MRRQLFAMTVLFAFVGGVLADEKSKPEEGSGPPPGKGWRKSEAAVAPGQKQKPPPTLKPEKPAPPMGKLGKNAPPTGKAVKAEDDGIGQQVSQWARSGIHGPQLAAMIHKLQATKSKVAPTVSPGKKPGKPEASPLPGTKPGKGKPKYKGEEEG